MSFFISIPVADRVNVWEFVLPFESTFSVADQIRQVPEKSLQAVKLWENVGRF